MRTLVKVAINAAAIWVAAALLEGMTLAYGFTTNSTKLVTALVVGALFGVVNALARPLAKLLGLPFLVLTLGLFIFVINAAMLMLTSWLAGQLGVAFHIDRFWPTAVVGAAIVSVVSWILGLIIDPDDERSDYRV